ncbi:Two-component response regulator ARR9 [Zea mays]|uniref:Two-component response regulator ARR9 n=1 Tax=Zea mays TaxID=4577 RepID=K7U6X7_MAIZE|nr:Two-component response regulator ARR9 [Zea mays]|eukprot:XP_008680710.1 two-component response regulator ORR10 [Zea mays]
MPGYDLLRKVKDSSSLRDIPVVIMSSENNPSRINRTRCLEEGADESFLKPVRLSDMSNIKLHILKSRCREQHHHQSDSDGDNHGHGCGSAANKSGGDHSRKRKAEEEENEDVLLQNNRPRHS